MNYGFTKIYRRIIAKLLLFCILCSVLFFKTALPAQAEEIWPYPGGEITAEAAVVMDADTQAVLWGRNQDTQYCPASITKLMTALLVLENCNLSDSVTVTADAVYGLESGATICGLMENEVLSVEDLLYALLLSSANDAANALAIHVGGSIAGFSEMMNQKAVEIGCKNSNFRNPSGLTDDEHVTTAYDMALIMDECLKYPGFMEIESQDTHKMPANEKNPNGYLCKMGHKMLRSGTSYSDDRVIAGKTGYIKASGNTLVTVGEENGRRVIVVVLKDKNPEHYKDTKSLLNFGLQYFDTVTIDEPVEKYSVDQRLTADKIVEGKNRKIIAAGPLMVTLPKNWREEDLILDYDYNLPASAPDLAVALMRFSYEGRKVGSVYILNDKESSLEILDVEDGKKPSGDNTPLTAAVPWKLIAAAVAALAVFILVLRKLLITRREKKRRDAFHDRHKKRLEAMGISEDDFNTMLEKRMNRKKDDENG